MRVQLGELASEYQYQQLVPLVPLDASRPASAVNVAATSVLAADPTDHPILWGECTGICDGEGGDYRWPTPPSRRVLPLVEVQRRLRPASRSQSLRVGSRATHARVCSGF